MSLMYAKYKIFLDCLRETLRARVIGQVTFEQGTTWKQISNNIFFPKDT